MSLVVDEYDEDWTRLRYVIVEGRAELLTQGARFGRRGGSARAPSTRSTAAMGLDRAGGPRHCHRAGPLPLLALGVNAAHRADQRGRRPRDPA